MKRSIVLSLIFVLTFSGISETGNSKGNNVTIVTQTKKDILNIEKLSEQVHEMDSLLIEYKKQ